MLSKNLTTSVCGGDSKKRAVTCVTKRSSAIVRFETQRGDDNVGCQESDAQSQTRQNLE
jgi:hypothetical protein